MDNIKESNKIPSQSNLHNETDVTRDDMVVTGATIIEDDTGDNITVDKLVISDFLHP